MQLSFDPRDRNAATAALAAIMALHPDLEVPGLVISSDLDTFIQPQAARLLEPDAPDPAEAFAGGASAEQAFAPVPSVSPAAPSPAATIPTPAPAPSPNPGGVEVDASGLPWDGRIHSGPSDKRPQNADKTWRKKRGVTDEEVAAVEAELRAALGAPAAAPAPIVPVAPVAEVPAAPVPPPPVAAAPVPASPPPAPVATAPIPAPAAPPPTPEPAATASGPAAAAPASSAPASTFAELMRKITSLQAAGTLTVEGTAAISQALGIGGVRDLITRPDLVPSFDALLPA